MKFKYNYWENKLWRIEENYSYEISEENRAIEYRLFGVKITFKFGENHYLVLNSDDEFKIKMTTYYTKSSQNGKLIHYEKQIERGWFQPEITFEFSEADRKEKE